MLWLTAAALAMSVSHPSAGAPAGPVVEARATATVRILAGVRLKLDGQPNADAPPARESSVRTEGAPRPALLIEFE